MAFKIGSDTVISDGDVLSNITGVDTTTINTLISYLSSSFGLSASLQLTLDNPNAFGTHAGDAFGSPADISGDYALFTATGEDDANADGSGKAYVFNIETGALVHTLDNPNSGSFPTSTNDRFGFSGAISGNYVIVGAPFNDFFTSQDSSGTVYIFNLTTGALVRTINNPNAYGSYTGDFFGSAIAASGNYAIIGAYGEKDSTGTRTTGTAYIFNIETGALVHVIDNPNALNITEGFSDLFGKHVDISGNYAIVGAEDDDDIATEQESEATNPLGQNSGRAFIFNVTTGALVHTLNNPNAFKTTSLDGFGEPVAISGNYAIVGAPGEAGDGTNNLQQSGIAYIFDVTTGALLHTLNNPAPAATARFGGSVDISSNYAIVGSLGTGDKAVYIFDVTTGDLVATIANPDAIVTSSDGFGRGVKISGNKVIISATSEDRFGAEDASGFESGRAYIYTVTTSLTVAALDDPALQALLDSPITYKQLTQLLG
jgi:hypothetical protein